MSKPKLDGILSKSLLSRIAKNKDEKEFTKSCGSKWGMMTFLLSIKMERKRRRKIKTSLMRISEISM
jgi:hypothetical protein